MTKLEIASTPSTSHLFTGNGFLRAGERRNYLALVSGIGDVRINPEVKLEALTYQINGEQVTMSFPAPEELKLTPATPDDPRFTFSKLFTETYKFSENSECVFYIETICLFDIANAETFMVNQIVHVSTMMNGVDTSALPESEERTENERTAKRLVSGITDIGFKLNVVVTPLNSI